MLLARKVENLLAESDEYAATYFTEHSTKMNFQLQPGVKFACVAFEDVAIDHSLSKPLSLGEGLWTFPEHLLISTMVGGSRSEIS